MPAPVNKSPYRLTRPRGGSVTAEERASLGRDGDAGHRLGHCALRALRLHDAMSTSWANYRNWRDGDLPMLAREAADRFRADLSAYRELQGRMDAIIAGTGRSGVAGQDFLDLAVKVAHQEAEALLAPRPRR